MDDLKGLLMGNASNNDMLQASTEQGHTASPTLGHLDWGSHKHEHTLSPKHLGGGCKYI